MFHLGLFSLLAATAALIALILFFFNKRLQSEIEKHEKTEEALLQSQAKLASYAQQTEQFSLSAASIVSIKDERILFSRISDAIVKYSDYERVLISLFHDTPPYRDLIGYAGVAEEIVNKVRKTDLNRSWYDNVFKKGIQLGHSSYYIPHTMKHILNQEATIYGEGAPPTDPQKWHPEDNLFVKMNGEDGEFIGVISVDTSKSGEQPTDEIVRPLEVYAALISQIIILKRSNNQRELLEAQLRQAQKMEAIGNLTGGIAHDFNNILGVILGNTDLAIDCTTEDDECSAYLKEISRAGTKAKNIVQHLLAYSRKTEKKLCPIRIDTTLDESIVFLRSTIPATITIIKDIALKDRLVLADATQINQIILNLGTNAVHAMEKTGGTLSLKAEVTVSHEPISDISSRQLPAGEYVKITVSDTGHGIDQSTIEQIFDPYFTTKEIGKGTGMGLAIVHGLVHSHDGAVTLSSQPGQGTTFSIYLPIYHGEHIDEQTPPDRFPSGTEMILLVDDDLSLLNVGRRYLMRLGYRVKASGDAIEALKLFSETPEKFDLIITDMTMPGMTGEILAEKILAIRPNIPIFLCTGYSNLMDENKAQQMGISGYFNKPLNYAKFAHALRLALDKQTVT